MTLMPGTHLYPKAPQAYRTSGPPPQSPEARLLSAVVRSCPPFEFENVDPEKFEDLVALHEITPVVFLRLSGHASSAPQALYETLKLDYINNIRRNQKWWGEFLRIFGAFRQKNIPLLPLKGIDILARSPASFDLRCLADIDVLVREDDLEGAESVFLSLGYRKNLEGLRQAYWQTHQCHLVFEREGFRVDTHFGVDFKRKHRVLLPRLWDRAQEAGSGNLKVRLLSPEDALFVFALHWRRFGNVLSLKQVMDVGQIIKESPELDWNYLLEESDRGKMKATTYFILLQAHLFCGTKIPEGVFKKLNIPFWHKRLIKRFLLKHTFESAPHLKTLYLKAHFLLYDTILEPILYLINIPYEQFCKFYDLAPYTIKADVRYRLRILYMALSLFWKRPKRRSPRGSS